MGSDLHAIIIEFRIRSNKCLRNGHGLRKKTDCSSSSSIPASSLNGAISLVAYRKNSESKGAMANSAKRGTFIYI